MRVLFINSVVDYGSTGKIVRDLSNGLLSHGHDTKIIYGRKESKINDNTFSIVNKQTTFFHIIYTRLLGRHGLHSNFETKKMIKYIEDYQPDIIHLHNLHGYFCNVSMLLDYLATKDVKIIWTLHDAWLISGSTAYFDFYGCKLWQDGCVECNSTKDYPEVFGIKRQKKNFLWKKEKLLALDNLTFITPSHWLKDLLSRSFLKEFPCTVVHNGIDTSIFKPTVDVDLQELYKDKKILLGVSNKWENRKGLNDFFKLNEMISDDYKIILIGLNRKEIESLPRGIIGISRTSNAQELAAYYTLATAFLNPTYEDNYPTTNLEAISCKTRVIAYDTGGNKEVPGVEIVEQGNVEKLHKQILIENDASIDSKIFSKETFINNMLEIYGG